MIAMATLKAREVKQALLKKGFRLFNNDHEYFILYVDGRKTRVKTKISHGEKEIDDGLIDLMKKQTHLSREEFLDLANCPLSGERYIELLGERVTL